jgi:hypothetical protein
VLQVLLGLHALLCEPLLQALLCAHQGLTGLSADVSSLVDDCRRELRDREAAGQHTGPHEGALYTGDSSSASGVIEGEAGIEVGSALADDVQVDAESPLRSYSGHWDSDAVCGADADTVMQDAADWDDEQAAAGGAGQGSEDAEAVTAGQSGGGSAAIDEDSAGFGEDSDSLGFGEDGDSLGDIGDSKDGEQDVENNPVSGTPEAASAEAAAVPARVTARVGVPRTNYTEEEQVVMRELNLSSLMYITPCTEQSGGGWRVRLKAAGVKAAYGERCAGRIPEVATRSASFPEVAIWWCNRITMSRSIGTISLTGGSTSSHMVLS